jgi:hypothetical protein
MRHSPALAARLGLANSENGRIRDLLAFNDINSPLDGARHDIAPSETRDAGIQAAEYSEQIDELEAERVRAVSVFDIEATHLHQTAFQTPRPNNNRRIGRGLLKPLIAIATAQYVIVTVLAGLTAITVASTAGKAINARFEPIIAALKRF